MNLTNIQTRYVVEVEFTRCTLKEQLHISDTNHPFDDDYNDDDDYDDDDD